MIPTLARLGVWSCLLLGALSIVPWFALSFFMTPPKRWDNRTIVLLTLFWSYPLWLAIFEWRAFYLLRSGDYTAATAFAALGLVPAIVIAYMVW